MFFQDGEVVDGGSYKTTPKVIATPENCFEGASVIKTSLMITRTTTPKHWQLAYCSQQLKARIVDHGTQSTFQ
jgi:hypothetical protein